MSAKGGIMQILRGLSEQRSVKLLEHVVHLHCSPKIVKLCENLKSTEVHGCLVGESIKYLGPERQVEDELVAEFGLPMQTRIFDKIIKDGSVFISTVRENRRSCNYYARLKNFAFIKVHGFIVDRETSLENVVGQIIKVKNDDLVPNIKLVDFFDRTVTLIRTVELDRA
ncbi:hypothetical protein QAD02_013102 [Eretmocerus hayati]|uniref:Uncharacterized protein n=1 Tax=Eretmocerus hayati TaxID=131215 RepID=A0ACC2P1N9_9HYME|nr:hypothetical protein QAD02_013102 [Eretmocerus hayati]